jgi:cysteinyl-tRNA synthetase
MSKSLGNFMTLQTALDGYGANAVRLAVLQTHYRRRVDLGTRELEAAAKGVERFRALERAAQATGVVVDGAPIDLDTVEEFRRAMDDDFNTPGAMATIFEAVRDANRAADAGDLARAASLVATVRELAGVLGLEVGAGAATDDLDIDALVRTRDEQRAARDFAGADAIRDELLARGVKLEDTPGGTIWHR